MKYILFSILYFSILLLVMWLNKSCMFSIFNRMIYMIGMIGNLRVKIFIIQLTIKIILVLTQEKYKEK